MIMSRADITKRLAEQAHMLEAHKYTTTDQRLRAADTMRDAARIIELLRDDHARLTVRLMGHK